MDIKKKFTSFMYYIESIVKKVISFYYTPFSDIEIPKPAKKPVKKSKKQSTKRWQGNGFINQIIEYYGKKIYILLLAVALSIFVAIEVIIDFGISYLWLSAYIITFVSFLSFYSGINAVLERKRSIIDGYTRFMKEFLIYRNDITFKTHILESKEESYPRYFAEELKAMKLKLNTKQSYEVLSEFFESPRNNFPELLMLKNLSLAVVSTKDDAIANALSEQLEYIENSRTILSSKLGFSKIFVFLTIGFIFLIQAFLIYQFSSSLGSAFSSGNGQGFSLKLNLTPTPINYFLLLYIGGISVILLIIATDLGTYDEDKIARHVLLTMLGLIILSSIMFFMHL